MITGQDVAIRLGILRPANVPAVQLYLELVTEDNIDITTILSRLDEIETTLYSLNRQIQRTQEIHKQCQKLQPIAAKHNSVI